MEVIRRCYVWALRVNVSDPSPWVTVFGPFECHENPYANIVQKSIIFSMKNIVHEIPYGKIVHEKPCENIAHEKPHENIAHEKTNNFFSEGSPMGGSRRGPRQTKFC